MALEYSSYGNLRVEQSFDFTICKRTSKLLLLSSPTEPDVLESASLFLFGVANVELLFIPAILLSKYFYIELPTS
jgi:hypothetical protein